MVLVEDVTLFQFLVGSSLWYSRFDNRNIFLCYEVEPFCRAMF